MDIDNARTGDVRLTDTADPRTRLAREKFFTQRPKPLERWLWRQRVPAAAERVFWFHWSEGARSGDWCSQFALHFIARQCEIDISTVTRAYQVLKRLGLIRRIDPGRDTDNPFEQATCITEVLLPTDVVAELHASPNRPSKIARSHERPAVPMTAPTTEAPAPRPARQHDPLNLSQRRARLKALAATLSATELERWNKAVCGTARRLDFDPETRVPAEIQAEIQQYLAARELSKTAAPPRVQAPASGPRRLSGFDTARLRHGLQKITPIEGVDELTRQVLWSIEAGSLRQFGVTHAVNIALKTIREGRWSRPHRMPPNWLRKLERPARPETCSGA